MVERLTGGLEGLARQRNVKVVRGDGRLTGPNVITVQTDDGETTVSFEHCIVAAGSSSAWLPDLPDDPRVMDSTGALEVADVPERLLVIGGGIIGLEMATVYDALGSRVTVVELMDQLIPGCDPDLVKPLHTRIAARYEAIHLGVRVVAVDGGRRRADGRASPGRAPPSPRASTASSSRSGGGPTAPASAPKRRGSRSTSGASSPSIARCARTSATSSPSVTSWASRCSRTRPTHEAKVAAEVIAGEDVRWDARSIPNVAYTDPEIAWTGLTETRARAEGIAYEKAPFPWAASGALVDPGPRRRPHEAARRARDTAAARRGHRRAQRRRADRRGRARDRGRLRRPGPRPDHPPAPDAVGDPGPCRRDGRRHDHRSHATADKAREHDGGDLTRMLERRTKIVATLGPATDGPGVLDRMVAAGVDCARLNCSHGTADDQRRRAGDVRAAAGRAGRPLGLLFDLQGPKLRLSADAGARALTAGEPVVFTGDPQRGRCRSDPRRLPRLRAPGHRALARS